MKMIKYALCLGVALGAFGLSAATSSAEEIKPSSPRNAGDETVTPTGNTDATKTDETMRDGYQKPTVAKAQVITSTPGDVKTSTDDNGAQPAEAPHDKVGTVPGEATPGDVKTSNDDNGHNPEEATHDKAVVK